jgi:hypothetical protein
VSYCRFWWEAGHEGLQGEIKLKARDRRREYVMKDKEVVGVTAAESVAHGTATLLRCAIYNLQLCDLNSRVHFCIWFLQSVVKGEIDPQLTFFSEEAWFHL